MSAVAEPSARGHHEFHYQQSMPFLRCNEVQHSKTNIIVDVLSYRLCFSDLSERKPTMNELFGWEKLIHKRTNFLSSLDGNEFVQLEAN